MRLYRISLMSGFSMGPRGPLGRFSLRSGVVTNSRRAAGCSCRGVVRERGGVMAARRIVSTASSRRWTP